MSKTQFSYMSLSIRHVTYFFLSTQKIIPMFFPRHLRVEDEMKKEEYGNKMEYFCRLTTINSTLIVSKYKLLLWPAAAVHWRETCHNRFLLKIIITFVIISMKLANERKLWINPYRKFPQKQVKVKWNTREYVHPLIHRYILLVDVLKLVFR